MNVYKAINAVQSDLAAVGISKARNNTQQNYKFRGIDDVYNALSPLLAKHGLCILPRVTSRECVERTTSKGNAIFYVTVAAEFDFVASEDGTKHTVVTYGEAMDSADKATNKAMSAAYKYACMQAFSIPTEGDNDADATTHDVAARNPNGTLKGPGVISATKSAFDSLPPDWQAWVETFATDLANTCEGSSPRAAKDLLDVATKDNDLQAEHIAAIWSKLPSKVRSQIDALTKKAA